MFVFDSLWTEEPSENGTGKSHQFSFRARNPLAKFVLEQKARKISQTRVLGAMLRLSFDIMQELGPLMHVLQFDAGLKGVSRGAAMAAIISAYLRHEYPEMTAKVQKPDGVHRPDGAQKPDGKAK